MIPTRLLGKAIESQIELHFALRCTVSEIQPKKIADSTTPKNSHSYIVCFSERLSSLKYGQRTGPKNDKPPENVMTRQLVNI